jgi:hypothetical protein
MQAHYVGFPRFTMMSSILAIHADIFGNLWRLVLQFDKPIETEMALDHVAQR